tara:strand:- start:54364 stop:54549 length:186 start_codon:yes stop_codon:yes gene_type:complete
MTKKNIRVYISTDNIGSECEEIVEVDADYYNSLDEEDKDEWFKDIAFNMTEWGYEEVEEDE